MRIIYISLIFVLHTVALFSQKYSNEFLSIGVSARAHGMGTAVTSNVADVTAGYWNPAGLTFLDGPLQIGAMHAEWFAGIAQYDYVGLVKSIGDGHNQVGAISIIRLGIDEIPNTLRLIGPDGSINYDNVTEFSAADYGFLFSYGRSLNKEHIRIGGTVKVIRRTIGEFGNAWGFGMDVGLQIHQGKWRFGFMARDLTSTFNAWSFSLTDEEKEVFRSTGNTIPESSTETTNPSFTLGVSYTHDFNNDFSLQAAMDLTVTTDGQRNTLISNSTFSLDPKWGVEMRYRSLIYLRGGINQIQEVIDTFNPNETTYTFQPNFGIGLQLKQIQIDYALTDVGDVADVLYSHIFSLTYTFKDK